jgi:hypothetical protein
MDVNQFPYTYVVAYGHFIGIDIRKRGHFHILADIKAAKTIEKSRRGRRQKKAQECYEFLEHGHLFPLELFLL